MKYLLVPIDRSSVSFCYYENPFVGSDPEPIPGEILQRAVDYAQAHALTVNFLYGRTDPPVSHRSIIESVNHAKIVPLPLAKMYPDSIVVIESREIEEAATAGLDQERNVIVRLGSERLPQLATTLPLLFGAFQRLTLCLTGLESITEEELEVYGQQLLILSGVAAELYHRGHVFELNVLSDRMILDKMRNCGAGIEHLTVGPDGRMYLCPGFLYDNPGLSVGNLIDGIQIPNSELLRLDHAPMCSVCDAYHCKRCFYLNKKLTLEINTPSRQQCMGSHKERNTAAQFLTLLQDMPAFSVMKPIPAIDHLDPFEVLDRLKNQHAVSPPRVEGEQPGDQPIREILIRICKVQEEILELLKKR